MLLSDFPGEDEEEEEEDVEEGTYEDVELDLGLVGSYELDAYEEEEDGT